MAVGAAWKAGPPGRSSWSFRRSGPAKPRDKAKVEGAVRIAQRWVLGRLRNLVFHWLAALNEAIAEVVADLNARVMRAYGKSRLELLVRALAGALD